MAELAPGARVGGYTIERLVGRGGYGAVYVARDRRLHRRVALKVLEGAAATDTRSRERFIEESRTAAALDHPNIIPIHEAGTAAGVPYIAMRYVPGPDLAGLIAREGALAPERVARIVAQVASALEAAHAVGLVHRDVKPGNVLLATGTDGADHAYLTDFGLSKHVGSTGAASQSLDGRFVGTVGYIAPEQIRGRPLDGRSDVYSLGCLAFHALTGEPPFARDSEIDSLIAHVEAPPPSVSWALPELAAHLDPVIARAMSKEPAERYARAGELAAELAAATAGATPSRAVPVATGRGASSARRTAAAAGLVITLLTVAGMLGATLTRGPGAPSSPVPSQGPVTAEEAVPSRAGSSETTIVHRIALGSPDPEGVRPEPLSLEPGRYRFSDFLPDLELTVPGGWSAYRDYVDGAGLMSEDGYLDFALPQVVFDLPCASASGVLLRSEPQDVVEWIQGHPSFVASDPWPVAVAGLPGIGLDVEVVEPPAGTCPQDDASPRVNLFPVAGDLFFVLKGERGRFYAIGMGDGPPLLIYANAEPAKWDALRTEAETIVTSMTRGT